MGITAHPRLIDFQIKGQHHKDTAPHWSCTTPPEHSHTSPLSPSYKATLSISNLHNHFPKKAWLNRLRFPMAKAPARKRCTNLSPFHQNGTGTPHLNYSIKTLCNFSIQLATSTEIGKLEIV